MAYPRPQISVVARGVEVSVRCAPTLPPTRANSVFSVEGVAPGEGVKKPHRVVKKRGLGQRRARPTLARHGMAGRKRRVAGPVVEFCGQFKQFVLGAAHVGDQLMLRRSTGASRLAIQSRMESTGPASRSPGRQLRRRVARDP